MPESAPRRRDTPLDVPVVAPAGADALAPSIIEPPRALPSPREAGQRTLATARALETLEAAYAAWTTLRAEQLAERARVASERRRLEEQGALLLGALKVSRESTAAAQAKRGMMPSPERSLATLVPDAEAKLGEVRAALDTQATTAEAVFSELLREAEALVRARVERQAKLSPPIVRLSLEVLPAERRILHLQRPSPDDAVTLQWVLTGRYPTRYDALGDDSTDDVTLPPPVLYPELGVAPDQVRPTPAVMKELLELLPSAWPVKGMLPLELTPREGRPWVRWLARGAVLEAEIEDGDGFRNLLTRGEAEHLTGFLLTHSLEQRLHLELVRG